MDGLTINSGGAGAHKLRNRLLAAGVAFMAALVSACGGGSMSSGSDNMTSCGASTCGAALLTMQDAAGDFLSYTVDVTSLKLTKDSGAVVETLPVTTRIDFAQLVNLSEILSAGQIPAGKYQSATMTVDYTNSSITADDGSGNAVTLSPVDSTGAAITTLTLTVNLNGSDAFNVLRNMHNQLAFDFNLAASNTVDLTAGTVTVTPMIYATTVPPATEEIRVRGAVTAVDTAGSDYTVAVHPFHNGSGDSGTLVVNTTATTSFEINGVVSSGADGLTALAAFLADATITDKITAAFGTLTTADKTFTATRVLAGTSVESSHLDHISGQVIARNGDTLTVSGCSVDHHDGSWDYHHGGVTVTLGDSTTVTEEGRSDAVTIADISVGQSVDVFGTLSTPTSSDDMMNSTLSMDATAGRVRMDVTSLWGLVTANATSLVTLNLVAIEGRDPSNYDFTGTGSDPTAYRVGTGTLDISGLTVPKPARMFGFMVPFGTAVTAGADFNAVSLVDYSAVENDLFISWGHNGSATALTNLMSTGLQTDTTGATHALVKVGPQRIQLSAGPMIVPSTSAIVFAIGHAASHSVESFTSFTDFETQLNTELTAASPPAVLVLAATGSYDSTTTPATFTATRLAVGLAD